MLLIAATSGRAERFAPVSVCVTVVLHLEASVNHKMLSKGHVMMVALCAVCAIFGTTTVEGAALNRSPRQLSSLLTLSGESNARIENGKCCENVL